MPFKDEAKRYYEKGFNVLPIRPKDKKPLVPSWEQFQSKRLDIKTLEVWLEAYPHANIAIITGGPAELVVVDVDGEEGRQSINGKDLPHTWIVRTGKGLHYYYRMPKGLTIRNATGILPKVDVRGQGGYVVAPGSIHENGNRYESVYEVDLSDIPECPPWVWREKQEVKATKKSAAGDELAKIKEGVGLGERNQACARLAGHYLAKGFALEDALVAMQGWNLRNKPPMPVDEVEKTVRSVANKENQDNSDSFRKASPKTLEEAKAIISKWLYYKDPDVIDLCLATAVSHNSTSDPIWLLLVGAASCGKTEILRAFDQHRETYFIDRITPATFVTGFKGQKGMLEKPGFESKTIVIQDMSNILSMHPTDKGKVMDSLRQIFNGKWYSEWGNGKKFKWEGKITILGGSTPAIESESNSMGDLGERFLYFRIDANDDETRRKMLDKSGDVEGKEKLQREEIADAIHGVLAACAGKDLAAVKIHDSYKNRLKALVDLAAMIRTPVKRHNYFRDQIEYVPQYEGPSRMHKACQILVKSLAIVRGRDEIDDYDYNVILKICTDSMPSNRRDTLRALLKFPIGQSVRAKEIAHETGYRSTKSVSFYLGDLSALGLLNREMDNTAMGPDGFNKAFIYEVKPEIRQKLDECGLGAAL